MIKTVQSIKFGGIIIVANKTEQVNVYHIPESITLQFTQLHESLKNVLDQIVHHRSIDSLTLFITQFIDFYQSFASEKEVFDFINQNKEHTDPIYAHSLTVALLSRMVGDLNHMHKDELDALTTAALLHDTGKLLIDPEILFKEEALTPHDRNLIKKHCKLGYSKLQPLFTDIRIPSAALMHHERCDGSGYPMGTKSENINTFARIISICDVYSGMVAGRKYRDSLCPFQVIRLFEKDGLQKYDPDFVILFLRSMLDTYLGYYVMLNTGETAKIIAINHLKLSAPTVQIGEQTINLGFDDEREILHIL